ncbi:MAG TPA: TIGR02678 family protein, partial [Bacillales bacterium]|nr:TIGR02678 family protein [Bacillales bacterium]
FKSGVDYALFCCLLAYLESRSVDEQFLLSDLCEELQGLYPGDDRVDWTNYEYRKSLVRVLKAAQDLEIVKVVDGEVEAFSMNESQEVLYEVPLVSRYFMRSYPKDLFHFSSKEEILAVDWPEGIKAGDMRRHRVYRKLLLSPVVYREGKEDGDFWYLRNFRNRLKEDIESHSDFHFELYKNAALLTMEENRARFSLFPDHRAISDIALQFAGIVRGEKEEQDIPLAEDGTFMVTYADFEKWVTRCKEDFGAGWSKMYREATISQIAGDLLEVLREWKMAFRDEETGAIVIYPLMARMTGRYPKDFQGTADAEAAKEESEYASEEQ